MPQKKLVKEFNQVLAKPKKKFDLLKSMNRVKIPFFEGQEIHCTLPERETSPIKIKPIMAHHETQTDYLFYPYLNSPSQNLDKLFDRANNDKFSTNSIKRLSLNLVEKRKTPGTSFVNDNSRFDKPNIACIESDLNRDSLKSQVITEYFSMIEELILVADQQLNLMLSNFSPDIWKNVTKPIRERFKVKQLQLADISDPLEGIFSRNMLEPIYCGEDTIVNLIALYKVFEFGSRKVEEKEYFREKRLDRILTMIEKLDVTTKIGKSPSEQVPIVGLIKNTKKVTGSVRGIDYKSKNKIVIYI